MAAGSTEGGSDGRRSTTGISHGRAHARALLVSGGIALLSLAFHVALLEGDEQPTLFALVSPRLVREQLPGLAGDVLSFAPVVLLCALVQLLRPLAARAAPLAIAAAVLYFVDTLLCVFEARLIDVGLHGLALAWLLTAIPALVRGPARDAGVGSAAADPRVLSMTVMRGGWYPAVEVEERDEAFLSRHAPPRPYGIQEQVVAELRGPMSRWMWIASATAIVAGVVLGEIWIATFALGPIWALGPVFVRLIRLTRHGHVRTYRATTITGVVEAGGRSAGNARIEVAPGRWVDVAVDARVAAALIARDGAVAVRVLIDDAAPSHNLCLALGPKALLDGSTGD